MTISVEKLSDEPILLVKITNPLDVNQDVAYLMQELERICDASSEQLFDVTDTTGLKVSFSDLVSGMAMLTKGKRNILLHPRIIGYAVAADSGLIQLGAKALGQVQYGNISAKAV